MEKGLQEATIMICLICEQAEIVKGFTSVKFERGEVRLVVNNVPALTCPRCGEVYVSEEVAEQLLRDADEMTMMGMSDVTHEYNEQQK
jgi:YgiT-type zinc finger domain-containing protein